MKILWNIILNIFSEQTLANHLTVIFHMTVGEFGPKGGTSEPSLGPADPTSRSGVGDHWEGNRCGRRLLACRRHLVFK